MINAFITTRLDYSNTNYVGVSQGSISHIQLIQDAAARLLPFVKLKTQSFPYFRVNKLLVFTKPTL